ncbi:MAG: EAL domain-containing protein [Methylotenera sp.]|nr:EAL domain-containing protein [Methylotenera sp.]
MVISHATSLRRHFTKSFLSVTARFFISLFVGVVSISQTHAATHHNQPGSTLTPPQNNTLIIGSEQDFPPFATGTTDASADGFTVDLWKAVATEAGINYTIRVRPFYQILQEFKDGKIDVLINLAQSDERHQFADFTVSHVVVNGAIFVRKGESNIQAEHDLIGKSIIVLQADLAHDYAVAKGWGKQLTLVNSAAEGLILLAGGKHNAMLLSKLTGVQTLQKLRLNNIKALSTPAGFSQKFAFAVHKGQPDLLSKLNEGLAITKANGAYDLLYEKWFGVYEPKPVGLSDLLKYLLPILLLFIGIAQYSIYRRNLERKATQKALQTSEAHLRLSQIGGGVGTWETDLINHTQTWSENCIAMLGFPVLSDPTWNDFIALIHPEDRQHVIDATNSHIEHGTKYDVEYRVLTVSGNYRWMRSAGQAEYDKTGKPITMRGIAQDVSERHQYLQHIEQLLSEQHTILENKLVGMITVKNRKVVWSNAAFARMMGYSEDEVIGASSRQFYANDEDYQLIGAAYADIESNEILRIQHEFVRKDGRHIWLDLRGAMLHPDRGESLWIFIDATERKLAEDAFRIAATVFESQEGMLITDENSVILRVNRAFSEITGYSADEAIGNTPRMLSSGHHQADFYAAMWQSIHSTGFWGGEIWNRRKNGEIYPEHLTITAVKDQNKTITNYVATLTDITMSKAAADEIQSLAFFDPLTGLPNRRLLVDRLNHALASSSRSAKQGALLFLDLDHFKMLNDSLGHDIGDLLLQQVAARLTTCVREGDTVARLGGDEFVVMLENLNEQDLDAAAQAESIANKIIQVLNEPYLLAAHEYHSTPSIGVTLFNNHHTDIEELLKQADISMYQAKKAGRNTIRFFNPQMQANITERVSLERALNKALALQQLQLYYQVQVDHLGQPTGAEALIRWQHPELGLVSPAQFISLAEETGLILPIGQWVLETACKQIQAWQQYPQTRHLELSVNVSAKQFHQTDFVALVHSVVLKNGINPMQLKLEITEGMLLERIDEVILTMQALKAIGVQFSLDDFGTGYSSLQYLKRLPLHQLKIDQSFVRDIAADVSDQAIVRTIIAMSQSLELDVIAEGVETEEQRRLLLNNHCRRYQGYLFGKPMPIEQFNASLAIS